MTVRVVIIDDSPTMRSLLSAALRRDPEIEIAGMAGDPIEARELIKKVNPDVLTLDVEMPRMDGLSFLEKLMRLRPMPVVMVSTLTHNGAEAALAALELGAVDCVGKPTANMLGGDFFELAEKVKAAARARVRVSEPRQRTSPPDFVPNGRMIAIGSSTGGVEALLTILSDFPEQCPPTVITQHMPPHFTASFAQRLDRLCAPKVTEAVDGDMLKPGHVYLAPGGDRHLIVTGRGAALRCHLEAGPPCSGHCPSVDRLFTSVAAAAGNAAVGIILTGMGRDGAQGLLAMRQKGAGTLGQDEASCVVYGMPRAAFEIGAVEQQLPIRAIAGAALAQCESKRLKVS